MTSLARLESEVRTASPRLFITCRCGAKWSGDSRCHCAGCHLTFSSLTAFDRHRQGPRRAKGDPPREPQCYNPETVGLTARTKKAGRVKYVIWGLPGTWDRVPGASLSQKSTR